MCTAEGCHQHPPLVTDGQEELDRLRSENNLLRTERNMLLRLATEFAHDAGLIPTSTVETTAHIGEQHEDETMNTAQDHPVWLTKSSYENLRAELAALRDERVSFSEPDTEGKNEIDADHITDANRRHARIRQIQDLLNRAVVGEIPPDDGIAEPGMILTVRFDDEDDTETFLLGTRTGETTDDLEVYSPEAPLGAALLGAREGERHSYTTPAGTTVHVTLLRAEPYGPELGTSPREGTDTKTV
ncbi:GreA/GreB family elongation factor [Actinopolyspora sp. H202]|uniref:GreA/GreB family elongation factor n=1 Tax=Actinopolyspora sp. H202 TaxID=1500456 RepID=UPI003EE7F6C1